MSGTLSIGDGGCDTPPFLLASSPRVSTRPCNKISAGLQARRFQRLATAVGVSAEMDEEKLHKDTNEIPERTVDKLKDEEEEMEQEIDGAREGAQSGPRFSSCATISLVRHNLSKIPSFSHLLCHLFALAYF